jgi:hypothetical protein
MNSKFIVFKMRPKTNKELPLVAALCEIAMTKSMSIIHYSEPEKMESNGLVQDSSRSCSFKEEYVIRK